VIQNNWQELIKPTTLEIVQKGEGAEKQLLSQNRLNVGLE